MKRSEMIRYIQASNVADTMKAAAILGISIMSKSDFERFSGLADEGLRLLEAGDYDGMLALLESQDAPGDLMQVARGMIEALRSGTLEVPRVK